MPLLEVVTRTCKRPEMLARNQASLAALADNDWAQSLLVDAVGMGIGASYRRLAHHAPAGEWVWVLDDDDECVWPELVGDIRSIGAAMPVVQVIMVRMDHGPELGVLPDALVWRNKPVLGHLGVSSWIVRAPLWMQCRQAFGSGHYASDFDFIRAVWQSGTQVWWHDVVASRCQRGRSLGAPEGEA